MFDLARRIDWQQAREARALGLPHSLETPNELNSPMPCFGGDWHNFRTEVDVVCVRVFGVKGEGC